MKIILAYVLQNLVSTTALGLEFLAILYCISGIFGEQLKINLTVIAMLAIDVIIFSAVREEVLPGYFTGVVHIMAFLYCFLKYKRSILITMKNYIVSIALTGAFEIAISIVLFPVRKILGRSEEQVVFILNLCYLFIAVLFSKFMLKKKLLYRYSEKKMMIVAIGSGLCMFYLLFDYRYRKELDQVYYLMFMGLVIVLYLYREKMQEVQFELEKRKIELEMQEIYGNAYEELLYEVRRKQHDFINQTEAIYSMHLTARSLEDLIEKQKEYGSILVDQCRYDKILTGCNNSILAGYLYYKCVNYEKNNVLVDYKIHVDKAECNLSLHELIETLGIFLTNAYENVDEEPDGKKVIELLVEENIKDFVIAVSNRSEYLTSWEIENIFQDGYSSKGKNRGIGLARVKQLAGKSQAEIIVENVQRAEKNWVTFRLVIPKTNG